MLAFGVLREKSGIHSWVFCLCILLWNHQVAAGDLFKVDWINLHSPVSNAGPPWSATAATHVDTRVAKGLPNVFTKDSTMHKNETQLKWSHGPTFYSLWISRSLLPSFWWLPTWMKSSSQAWQRPSFLRSSRVKPVLLDWLAGLGTSRRRLITSTHDLWIFYTLQDSRFSTALSKIQYIFEAAAHVVQHVLFTRCT